MAHTYTRTTYIWFVAATITGIVSGFLHLVRTHVTQGGNESLILTILAFGLLAVTALLIFRGIMVAAYEQDRASKRDPAGQVDADAKRDRAPKRDRS